ncbi:MAG TPA: response regulator [Anaerolineales bacterium]|nr:response regulator [Anaerolineales bacterium]
MQKKVLWLDNDPAYLEDYVKALERAGYNVTVVTNVTAAESALQNEPYDLLLLDVMIPTKSEGEEKLYPPETTDSGLKTGLMFYERMKSVLVARGTAVLVMTVRLDSGIVEGFEQLGLDRRHFSTKMALRETQTFMEKIERLVNNPETTEARRGE